MLMIITIDGPAGTGKSTVTKKVAERLNMIVLDTGALYRAIAYGMLQKGIDLHDEAAISRFLQKNPLDVVFWEGSFHYFIEDFDTTMYLRTQEVANAASIVSTYSSVRSYLLAIQRKLAENKNVVCEGRDMGTTVFPEAKLKIYLTASVQERAKRRFLELVQAGLTKLSIEEIEKEIEERDRRDSTREISPLRVPEDAFMIDTTNLTLEQVVDEVIFLAKEEKEKSGFWEHFTHQADVGIRGVGATPAEAFEQAAMALTAIITNPSHIRPKTLVTVKSSADTDELLLVDWLNAIIFEMATKNMLFSRFHVTLLPGFLQASLWGEAIDRKKHQPAVEIKGATYHLLSVKQRQDGLWTAECVVDV
jgi:CMP/dCMP kinase